MGFVANNFAWCLECDKLLEIFCWRIFKLLLLEGCILLNLGSKYEIYRIFLLDFRDFLNILLLIQDCLFSTNK